MRPLHASDQKSFARCAQQYKLALEGRPQRQGSRTSYGSVIHHALTVLERTKDLEAALNAFEFYWNPSNIEAICPRVDDWLVRDTWNSMHTRGIKAIRDYAEAMPWEQVEILALEHSFTVPLHGTVDPDTGGPLMLAGSIDRLVAAMDRRQEIVRADDWKSSKERPTYLRHNSQGTAYCYASEQPEFWLGNPEHHVVGFGPERGQQLYERFAGKPRKFVWVDVNTIEFVDGGYRGQRDYERFKVAMQELANSIHAGIFPLVLDGGVCRWCSFRDSCAGVGVDDADGKPDRRLK